MGRLLVFIMGTFFSRLKIVRSKFSQHERYQHSQSAKMMYRYIGTYTLLLSDHWRVGRYMFLLTIGTYWLKLDKNRFYYNAFNKQKPKIRKSICAGAPFISA